MDSKSDIYSMDLELGKPTAVGAITGGALKMNAALFGFDPAGVHGNPHPFLDATGAIRGVFYDDEDAAEQSLFIRELESGGNIPAGPWKPAVEVPVSVAGAAENQ